MWLNTPFGTIKRALGFDYFLHRGLEYVNAEAAFISLAYDLKRISNISNIKDIMKKMDEYFTRFSRFFCFHQKNHKLFFSFS